MKWIILLIIMFGITDNLNSSSGMEAHRHLIMSKLNHYKTYVRIHAGKNISSDDEAMNLVHSYNNLAIKHVVPITLFIALSKEESHYNKFAVNHDGTATGLGQTVYLLWIWYPKFTQVIKSEAELFIPDKNIEASIIILKWFLEQEEGNLPKALDRYSGYATNYSQRVLNNKRILDEF